MTAFLRKFTVTLTGIVLSLVTIDANSAQATNYTFTKIADTNSPFDFFLSASINDNGTVVFDASLDEGGDGLFDGIFIANNGEIATLVDTSGSFDDFLFAPIINNEDTVAFGALLDDGSTGIFTSNGGTITTIADSRGSFADLGGSTFSINDNGTVAFNAFLDTGVQGIFTGNGESNTTIIDNSEDGIDPRSGFFFSPDINNKDTVAFSAFLNNDFGIFASSEGSISTIIPSRIETLELFDSFYALALNNKGMVAVHASLPSPPGVSGEEGIFVSSGGAIATIVNTSGSFENVGDFGVAINDKGTVAFEACLDGNIICGIYTGPDPVKDKVIDKTDLLLGSELNQLIFFRDGLNNSGQIVFRATFENGTSGIFRADPIAAPIAVPEPVSVLSLLAFGAFGTGSVLLRQQKTQKSAKKPTG